MNPPPEGKRCFHCGNPIEISGRVGRSEVCSNCGYDLHVCRNCLFYAPGAYNDCRETQAERVLDKERANYCEFFTFRAGGEMETVGQKDALKRLEALFRHGKS